MDSTSRAPTEVIRKIFRVKKEDSAFVYNVLESHEGIAFYSTLNHVPGEAYRDIELSIPLDFVEELEQVLKSLDEQGVSLHEVRTQSPLDKDPA